MRNNIGRRFLQVFALFDPVMNEHLRAIKNQEVMIHFLRKNILNELMKTVAKFIKNKILSFVKSSKYYSIILDCMPDVMLNS